jgi:hypothetical protein
MKLVELKKNKSVVVAQRVLNSFKRKTVKNSKKVASLLLVVSYFADFVHVLALIISNYPFSRS